MAKMMAKRVGVLSAAKMYSMVGFGIGLIVGVIYGLIVMMFGAAMMMSSSGTNSSGAGAGAGASGLVIGLLIMVGFPILYGVMCFVAGAVGALIYNIAAKIAGGIELELENAEPNYGAPPQPQQPQYGGQY
ncbi:MAG TPA: DUF3566 domain-containing protein [Blastocatellia bacterium]|nr:DUF3566 domain-containing protein [Blastocatellia bacterium]